MTSFKNLFEKFNPKNAEADFKKIAKLLMTEFIIKVNNSEFYLTEIEFYCKTENDEHKDPYVHGNDLQKEFGKWYFHGSGLDLTFGNENYYGGVLIRGIKTKTDENKWKYISGPINVVRTLFSYAKDIEQETIFRLISSTQITEEEKQEIIYVKRIGLNKEKYPENTYWDKKYRAITDVLSKHKFAEKTNVAREIYSANDLDEEKINNLFWNNILK